MSDVQVPQDRRAEPRTGDDLAAVGAGRHEHPELARARHCIPDGLQAGPVPQPQPGRVPDVRRGHDEIAARANAAPSRLASPSSRRGVPRSTSYIETRETAASRCTTSRSNTGMAMSAAAVIDRHGVMPSSQRRSAAPATRYPPNGWTTRRGSARHTTYGSGQEVGDDRQGAFGLLE